MRGNIVDTLPNKPSELLALALEDLILVEKDPRYKVHMGVYHCITEEIGPECFVCLAGTVMAKTLDVDLTDFADPYDYHKEIRNKLLALDYFRIGALEDALFKLGVNIQDYDLVKNFEAPPYSRSAEEFKDAIKNMIRLLQSRGL